MDGFFTPNEKIRRMARVENRPEEVKRLRCAKCGYEIASNCFVVYPQGTLSVQRPVHGHFECSVGMKISPFTTVDESRSIPVSSDTYFSKSTSLVERRTCYDKKIKLRRSVVDGVYTLSATIRRMPCVEQRSEGAKRLRCITCNYEFSSSWFVVSRQGIAKVLKPKIGHNACRVGSKSSPFTTVDRSRSACDGIRHMEVWRDPFSQS